MKEFWKDILGSKGRHQISSLGRVKSLKRPYVLKDTILNTHIRKNGYAFVSLTENKTILSSRINRLVAIAFIPNPHNYPEVNHKNGIKTDNRSENLEWVTHQQNMSHAASNGLMGDRRGESNGCNKLNESDIKEIRRMRSEKVPLKIVTGIYKIHRAHVAKIIARKCWAHVA